MEDMFDAWKGEMDDEALSDIMELVRSFRVTLRRLGSDPKEDLLIPVLEKFCHDVAELDQKHGFLDDEKSTDIKQWYEEMAVQRELCVVSLDDLDDPPTW